MNRMIHVLAPHHSRAGTDGAPMREVRDNIKLFTLDELKECLGGMGIKPYKAAQVFSWMYKHNVTSFNDMTNISLSERALMDARFTLPRLSLIQSEVSKDGTQKFLFRLDDDHTVESVLIPDERRLTLCISTQVGCAQACRFCLTGQGGFKRDLAAYEIAEQVAAVEGALSGQGGAKEPRRRSGKHITNIVLMGMGEPLANFIEVQKAIGIVTAGTGLGFSPRRITLSTAGLVPEIERLGRSGARVNLAVSLNAATDAVRTRVMPVNKRYPLRELIGACRRYPLEPRRRITFEYVLLTGVNDSEGDARRLAKLLRGIRCKINLIPFNPFPGSAFSRPDDETVRRFQEILLSHNYTAPVRSSRGADISAACGQLRERTAAGQAAPMEKRNGKQRDTMRNGR